MPDAPTPIPEDADAFRVLGLPRALLLDRRDLDRILLGLSRQNHPDRFAGAGPGVTAIAERNSAKVNDAVRILKDPVARAELMLALEGVERPADAPKCPPDLLMEVFELRERLSEDPDPALRAEAEEMLAAADAVLLRLYEAHDRESDAGARAAVLGRIRAALDRRKFLAGLAAEIRQTLT